MHSNVLDWEPHTALFVPDNDPLLFYRTIAQKATTMLCPGGKLYFEINRAHGKETMEMLAAFGYTSIEELATSRRDSASKKVFYQKIN